MTDMNNKYTKCTPGEFIASLRNLYLGCTEKDPDKDINDPDWLPLKPSQSFEAYNEAVGNALHTALPKFCSEDIEILKKHQRLFPNSDLVFGTMFGKPDRLTHLLNTFIPGLLENAVIEMAETQKTLSGSHLMDNSIRVDIAAKILRPYLKITANSKADLAVDMQITYNEPDLRKRITFYACRMLSSETFKSSRYDQLKPVFVTFFCTAPKKEKGIKKVSLMYQDADGYHNYCDLLNIYEVDLASNDTEHISGDKEIYEQFFTCRYRRDLYKFAELTASSDLAYSLLEEYIRVVSNTDLTFQDFKEDYAMKSFKTIIEETNAEVKKIAFEEGIEKGIEKGAEMERASNVCNTYRMLRNMHPGMTNDSLINLIAKSNNYTANYVNEILRDNYENYAIDQ